MSAPTDPRPLSAPPDRAPHWLAGLVFGGVIGVTSLAIPLSGHLENPDTHRWIALAVEQFGIQLDLAGWSINGLAAAILGMVVALVAFVGMRDAPIASQRRRDLLIEAAGYLVVVATALSTVASLALLASVMPVSLLQSLSHVGSAHPVPFDAMILNRETGGSLRLQFGQVLVGFVAVGLLGASRQVDKAVHAWAGDEAAALELEREYFTRRIDASTQLLNAVVRAATRIRNAGVPDSRVTLLTSIWTVGIALLASAATTGLFIMVRHVNGADPGSWWTLALGSSAAALMHAYLTSVAYLSLRKAQVEHWRMPGFNVRRWSAALVLSYLLAWAATLFVPLPLAFLLTDWSDLRTAGNAIAIVTLLFVLPSVHSWFSIGKNSWYEVALRSTARALRASTQDDQERLNRLSAAAEAVVPSTTEPNADSAAVTENSRARGFRFLGLRVSRAPRRAVPNDPSGG